MKKIAVILVIAVLIAASVFALSACGDKDDTATLESIAIKVTSGNVFYVGDTFDASKFTITATLSDDSKVTVTNTAGFVYDKSGLNLDAGGKYTQAGERVLKVIYLDQYEATVTFTVNAAK